MSACLLATHAMQGRSQIPNRRTSNNKRQHQTWSTDSERAATHMAIADIFLEAVHVNTTV